MEDYIDNSGPALLLDVEELDNEREYTTPIYSKEVMGFAFTCPRCEGKHTFYSALEEDWVCMDCRLIFSWELAQIFNDLRENDNEY